VFVDTTILNPRVLTGGADNKINLFSVSPADDTIKVSSSIMGHYKTVSALSWIDSMTP
jgi:hypothetical protein